MSSAGDARQRVLKPVGAAVLALLGVGAILSGVAFGAGSLDSPGPGMWPAVLGGALVLSAVAFLVFNRDGKERAFGREVWNALIVVGSIVAFVLLFEHVSFLLASVVLLAGCQLAAGATRWLTIAITCVLGTGAAWLLFFVVLGVTTPL
jgi:putative tricarboxylic transport membrane protein